MAKRAIAPIIIFLFIFIFSIAALFVGPAVWNVFTTNIVPPTVNTGGTGITPGNPVTPPTIVVPTTPGPTIPTTPVPDTPIPSITFTPVVAISNVNFCDTTDEMLGCTTSSASFAFGVKRVYATVVMDDKNEGSTFDLAWYQVVSGSDELKFLDTYTLSTDNTFTTSLSTANEDVALQAGTYLLKFIQEGTELGSYQFTVA